MPTASGARLCSLSVRYTAVTFRSTDPAQAVSIHSGAKATLFDPSHRWMTEVPSLLVTAHVIPHPSHSSHSRIPPGLFSQPTQIFKKPASEEHRKSTTSPNLTTARNRQHQSKCRYVLYSQTMNADFAIERGRFWVADTLCLFA